MLNLTLPKTDTAVRLAVGAGRGIADVIADVDRREAAGDIQPSTAASYRAALRSLAKRLNLPVEICPVDLDRFDLLFPYDGFDPDRHSSEKAFHLWRNRARSCLEHFLGIAAAKRALRDVEDGWTGLMTALKPLTEGGAAERKIAPQALIALGAFAQVCRWHDRQPWEVDLSFMVWLEPRYQGNRRTSNRTAATRMDEVRSIPEALQFLPPDPIGFEQAHCEVPLEIPAAFSDVPNLDHAGNDEMLGSEPRRVCRRLVGLSHATIASSLDFA